MPKQDTSALIFPVPKPTNAIPTATGIEHLDPMTVAQLLKSRTCELIDLRSYDRGAGLIDGARHVPSSEFPLIVPQLCQQLQNQSLVVFTCQYSAHRAPQCANWYKEKAPPNQRVAILAGGFRGWEAAGLPVQLAGAEAAAMPPGSSIPQAPGMLRSNAEAAYLRPTTNGPALSFGQGIGALPGAAFGAMPMQQFTQHSAPTPARQLTHPGVKAADYDAFALEAGARLAASVNAPLGKIVAVL
jgi:rhodanese-related sulfurtransferase